MIELIRLFLSFFKVGLFTFGGGYAMIPLIEDEVINNQWLDSMDTLVDFIAVSESTPGPFAINIATFIGYHEAGVFGAIFATLGVVMPSFIIIYLVAKFFTKIATNRYVQGFLSGVKPAIVGIILSVGIAFLVRNVFSTEITDISQAILDWRLLAIAGVLMAFVIVFKKMNPIYLILISGALGLLVFGLM
ncbi:MAG TPA: chromate transporter [Bacillota bacterium]|nr:chromate transporter [Bacillota bacterium]HPF42150.1 chromate transporter [Bacillota bacterium]HPJ85654.1 chromate transporter [Bacillota bacterium]HPQ61709.1 chromate transporter [Bacillota bacterium]HRX92356.1 chromate transporter [Candidatus Izemoplasmatales bacterium]